MRDKGINPVSVTLQKNGVIEAVDEKWEIEDITGKLEDNPVYKFEEVFEPYRKFSRNEVDKIDLVVSLNGIPSIPLEVKLTVVPDSGTSSQSKAEWAPEIVIRPVSSAYAMMGVAKSLLEKANESRKNDVINAIKPVYNSISSWNNKSELTQHLRSIHDSLSEVLTLAEPLQRPFLVQPVWRTKGQSLELHDQCFDVFVWSDVAVMGIPVHESCKNKKPTRAFREVARHTRSLYDILKTGDYDYSGIYKGMSHGKQTDKSFSISGKRSLKYLRHARLAIPSLEKSVLEDLILNEGHKELKPERRFDLSVKFEFGMKNQQEAK